jgi:UDP-N-acetylmuramoyl-L-alanyl-D-glutamate--2,6-diaminopimelate ligase
VDSVAFDVAIMTNLTHEHLDYHHTMEAYLNAKSLLFRLLPPAGCRGAQPGRPIV